MRQWDGAKSPADFLEIQERIAEGILRSEGEMRAGTGDREDHSLHMKKLRLYADGLAWRVLHPHAIRQLAKNQGHPLSLISQGDAFQRVLDSARQHLKSDGLPVLIADITNVIKIGDLIVVTHPELPQIVECKTRLPHPTQWMRGRLGRQISRALGTLRYLSGKPTKVYGEGFTRVVLESDHQPEHNWAVVSRCANEALKHGESYCLISEREIVWACQEARTDDFIGRVARLDFDRSAGLFVGTSLGVLEMSDGLYPPPVAWPLSADARFALMEGDLIIGHIVSSLEFKRDEGGVSLRVADNPSTPVLLTIDDKEYPFSVRFVYDVLYGFETVASCVRGLLSFADQVQDLRRREHEVLDEVPRPTRKPEVTYLASEEDAFRHILVESGDDIVAVPEDVWRSTRPREDGPGNGD